MPVTTRPDLFRWQQGFARGLRGAGKNEVVVMMAKSGTGKSMYYDIEAQNEKRTRTSMGQVKAWHF